MADDAEDILELEDGDVIEEQDEATPPDVDAETDEDGEDEETFIRFEGEDEDEAAPASESESSVIREMRRKLRETERELNNLRKGQAQPAKIEVGPKPTLESCDYDEEAFENRLDAWKAQKAKADAQEAEAEQAEERQRTEWTETVKTYQTAKAELALPGYDDAEAEVFSVLHQQVQALILRQKTAAPALVYALSRSPAKLEELSKLNLADAAVMVGELKAKVKVEKRPKLPNPDKAVVGRTSNASGDKELKRLEREAERTGDRTALIRYRRQLNA